MSLSSFISSLSPSPKEPKSKEYFEKLDLNDLVLYIQPLWNTYNMGRGQDKMSATELKDLELSLTEYKRRGLDIAYFTSGAGAPGNCIIV